MLKKIFLVSVLLVLAACDGLTYQNGKTASDIPANVQTVSLKSIYLVGGDAKQTFLGPSASADSNNPQPEASPSQNDLDVLAVARDSVIRDLAGAGYRVVDANAPADVGIQFFVSYQPEMWPLVNRHLAIAGTIYDARGVFLFKILSHEVNAFGLIGAAVGDSRDEMTASTAKDVIDQISTELHKGSKSNVALNN